MVPVLLLVALSACGPDVSVSKVAVDADNDGYDAEVDCDDARDDVNPTAEERCDGRDNDCDDSTDEEAVDAGTFYIDTDGDGFGDPDASVRACEAAPGTTTDATDCDDTNASVHPEASEACNIVDDDCDGDTDEEAADVTTAYLDADGDGYGDASTGETACTHPATSVPDHTDCDDTDADIHPDAPEPDCADATDYNCDGSVAYEDADADGWAACEDCDDSDPGRSPGNPEVCDGAVDEDCDTLVDDADPDVSDPATWYRDADGDAWGNSAVTTAACAEPSGFATVAGDCDDYDPSRSPGLTEVCDATNLDEDCSGAADDLDAGTDGSTFTTFARDDDGDGYGDASRTVTMCDAPAGYGLDDADCDDTDPEINPSAPEVCNGADDDCDGATDDDDGGVTDPSLWHLDADGDGYGDASAPLAACALPSGYAANDEDCDDGAAAVNPIAVELCNGSDDDCDALADDDDPSLSGATTWYADSDGDGFGDAGSTRESCIVPSGFGTDTSDCDDADEQAFPGAVEVCGDTTDQDCDGVDPSCGLAGAYTIADADVELDGGTSSARWGSALAAGFDFDGDGWEDIAVGGGYDAVAWGTYGALDVITGASAGVADGHDAAAFHGYGDITDNDFDMGVWGLNDLDADGDDELAVMLTTTSTDTISLIRGPQTTSNVLVTSVDYATYSCNVVASAGTSNALTGNQDWLCGNYDGGSSSQGSVSVYSGLGTLVGSFVGEDTNDYAGLALGGGEDLDGDGYDDYLIGAPHDDDFGASSGAAYIVHAPIASSTTFDLSGADARVVGTATGDYAGYGVARSPGDVDGDGYADVLVGAHGDDRAALSAGSVMLFYGPLSGDNALAAADITVLGTYALQLGGNSSCVASGDADGDGEMDILLGAGTESTAGAYAGMAWLVSGPLSGAYDLGAGDYTASFSGSASDEYLGSRCALSDLDHDGVDDVVIAGPYVNVGGGEDVGTVLGFFGG